MAGGDGRGGGLGEAVPVPHQDRGQHRHQRHHGHDRPDPPRGGTGRGCRHVRGAVLQQARPAHDRGPLPGHRRRRRPADHRLQRSRPDRGQHRGDDDPQAGRAPSHRGRQGSLGQHGPDRDDPARPAGRLLGHGRRRRLDPVHAGHGRRRRHLHLLERDPGRDGGDVRRRLRRRLGRRAPHPRSLAAADEGQLRRRAEPGSRQGGLVADGTLHGQGEDAAAAARRAARRAPAHGSGDDGGHCAGLDPGRQRYGRNPGRRRGARRLHGPKRSTSHLSIVPPTVSARS